VDDVIKGLSLRTFGRGHGGLGANQRAHFFIQVFIRN